MVNREIEQAKQIIISIVKAYIELFPQEFKAFENLIRPKKDLQLNDFASLKGGDFINRLMTEIPETLHSLLYKRLNNDQYNWYSSKQGTMWFAKTFKAFRVPDKI